MIDIEFFRSQGYVVVPNVVSEDLVDAVCEAVEKFCGVEFDDPLSWTSFVTQKNGLPELTGAGMVELYHHPSMWALRQNPEIYSAFAQIWEHEALWVSIDRCNLNLPQRIKGDFEGFVHWDVDTSVDPLPFSLQGFVALTACEVGGGGFQCVPGMPARLHEWIQTQPEDRNPFKPDLKGLEITEIPVEKGDVLIWNSLLPHGTSVNKSCVPRLVQYLSMAPAEEDDLTLKNWRVQAWKNRLAPEGDAFPGDPRKWEQKNGITAELSELGRKLLGLDPWMVNNHEIKRKGNQKYGAPGF